MMTIIMWQDFVHASLLSRYFPDNQGGKPWSNTSPHSVNEFWNDRSSWYSTWNGEDAALKVDSVKVWNS